jgi:hypothetical protein
MGGVLTVVLVVEVEAVVDVVDVEVVEGLLVEVEVEEVEVEVVVVFCRRAAEAGTAIRTTNVAAKQLRTIPRGKLILLWHLLL